MSAAVMAAGAGGVSFRTPYLAWSYAPQDEQRFRKVLGRVLMGALIACVAFTLLPRPKEERVVQEVPPRLAKLLLERDNVPPPAVKPVPPRADPAQQRKAENNTTATPEPKRPEPKREAAKGAPVPEARNPIAGRPPGEIDAARRRVAGIGLLANSKDLNELRGAPVAVQLRTDIKQGPGVGTGVGVGVGAGNEQGIPIRSMITSNAQGGSGGINTASYSNYTGGGGLAGRATTLVAGAAGGGGGGGPGGGGGGGKGDGTGLGSGDGVKGAKGGVLSKGGSGKGSSRCAPPSTRSCTPRWSSAWARASSRWPSGWSRCTRAWARCRRWRRAWAIAQAACWQRQDARRVRRGATGALLEQVFTPEQYAANVAPCRAAANGWISPSAAGPRCSDRGAASAVWLPIDAKFPREDYERLLDAQERADAVGAEAGRQGAGGALRLEARTHPPTSTSRRRTPPTSRSLFCPPRACTPRCCAAPA
jgi:hypothetical protein